MQDRTLIVVFKNPQPQRSSIRARLYLLRRDGSTVQVKYPEPDNPIGSK